MGRALAGDPTWSCAWGGCIFAGNSKSGRRKFAYVNTALHSPHKKTDPHHRLTEIRQVVWGRGHPTPCKRATHSCEGWVLDPAQRACAGQLLSTQARGKAPGSSLVRVCQRSRAVSG